MDIVNKLIKLQDKNYAEFQAKLIPTIKKESIIGVRVPVLRTMAKELIKNKDVFNFLNSLPHQYFDENMLHALLISEIKEYNLCIETLDNFLPYVDNWAVCDILSPKIFKKNKEKLIDKIKEWSNSKETYVCRFGLGMLMGHFLDDEFKVEYLNIPAKINSKEYYVNMMIAWLFATALAKKWSETVLYLENKVLYAWVHNKTIQKACESNRISKQQKEYLKSLKIR